VDQATWLFHLRALDYSRWIRDVVKDDDLAQEVASIELSAASRLPRASRSFATRSIVDTFCQRDHGRAPPWRGAFRVTLAGA
jgi:hypothetical protein